MNPRLAVLLALTLGALALNLAPGATAQEAEPTAVTEAAPDPYGPPIPHTRGNPWTAIAQTWLRQNGFRPGPSDAWYGAQTVAAVQRFQRAVGLPDHGWWDWETAMAQQAYVPPSPSPQPSISYGIWDRLAQCESNGNWSINTGNGYYGGLQFALRSWRAAGGTGYPHHHSREEQIRVAENLLRMQGFGAWPTCARRLGLL